MNSKPITIAVLLVAVSCFLNSFQSAYAVGRLQTCDPKQTNGVGLDGSNCDNGLVCDRVIKVCGYPSDVLCQENGCSVGTVCMDDTGQRVTSATYGTCQPFAGGSSEDNAISDLLCNIYGLITGKAGRVIIAIVLVGAGATFLLGKMQLGTMLAIGGGTGLIFGAPAVVKVLVGRGFVC